MTRQEQVAAGLGHGRVDEGDVRGRALDGVEALVHATGPALQPDPPPADVGLRPVGEGGELGPEVVVAVVDDELHVRVGRPGIGRPDDRAVGCLEPGVERRVAALSPVGDDEVRRHVDLADPHVRRPRRPGVDDLDRVLDEGLVADVAEDLDVQLLEEELPVRGELAGDS